MWDRRNEFREVGTNFLCFTDGIRAASSIMFCMKRTVVRKIGQGRTAEG